MYPMTGSITMQPRISAYLPRLKKMRSRKVFPIQMVSGFVAWVGLGLFEFNVYIYICIHASLLYIIYIIYIIYYNNM